VIAAGVVAQLLAHRPCAEARTAKGRAASAPAPAPSDIKIRI